MNSIFLKPIVAGFAMVAFAVIGTSSAQDNPTEIVKERQQLMKSMGKSFGPIIPVIKGESDDLSKQAKLLKVVVLGNYCV